MEQEGHQAPAPRAAPRDLQAGDMRHCWGGRLAAPPRPSHMGWLHAREGGDRWGLLAPGSSRAAPARGCCWQPSLERAASPNPTPPGWRRCRARCPPPLPNRGHHVGPAGSFPGHLGPAHSAKGSAQAAGLLRLPRVPVTPARGWEGPGDQSRGGGGGVRRAAPEGVPAPGSAGCHLRLQGRQW